MGSNYDSTTKFSVDINELYLASSEAPEVLDKILNLLCYLWSLGRVLAPHGRRSWVRISLKTSRLVKVTQSIYPTSTLSMTPFSFLWLIKGSACCCLLFFICLKQYLSWKLIETNLNDRVSMFQLTRDKNFKTYVYFLHAFCREKKGTDFYFSEVNKIPNPQQHSNTHCRTCSLYSLIPCRI